MTVIWTQQKHGEAYPFSPPVLPRGPCAGQQEENVKKKRKNRRKGRRKKRRKKEIKILFYFFFFYIRRHQEAPNVHDALECDSCVCLLYICRTCCAQDYIADSVTRTCWGKDASYDFEIFMSPGRLLHSTCFPLIRTLWQVLTFTPTERTICLSIYLIFELRYFFYYKKYEMRKK